MVRQAFMDERRIDFLGSQEALCCPETRVTEIERETTDDE